MKDEIIVVENSIDAESWVHKIHLMSNDPIPNPAPIWGEGNVKQEAGVHHFCGWNAIYRGLVKAIFEGGSERMAAVWRCDGYENLRAAILDAVAYFEDKTNIRAEFVFVRTLPKSIEEGVEFQGQGQAQPVLIFSADWVMPKYIFVCARTRGL